MQDQVSKVQDNVQTLGGTQELLGMTKGVGETLNAVKSGDFDKAKQEFGTVQQGWTDVSTKLKASPEKISGIKGNLETIATDLKASPPDKDKLVGNLQTLSGSLGSLAKGEGTSDSASDSEGQSADKAQTFNDNLLAMKDALAKTSTAVESSDFTNAKTSFGEARQTWFKFGGIVKEKSADSYQTLDRAVKTVNSALNEAEPVQETVLADITAMTSELDTVSAQ